MAMGTERSKALHNFTMPCGLRWGNHRILRCMRVNSDGQTSPLRRHAAGSSGGADHHHRSHHPIQQRRTTRERDKDDFAHHESPKLGPTPFPYGGRRFSDDADDGIAATREKVMLDLQTAADKMKDAIFKDGLEEGEVSASLPQPPPPPPPPPAASADAEGEAYCPWNLRTRRAAGRSGGSPAVGGGGDGVGGKSLRMDAPPRPAGSSQMRAAGQKSPMHRSDGGGGTSAAASGEKREREKFAVALSKRDIEEDFYAMVGHRPPRRPKKRARIVQKQLDTLFPGLWLTEVTPDMYKVIEAAP
ncbi:uncharacterized protein LOC131025079 [Salvia miltiorrhiza]|uniref:uncharacterized protein LOC131025079 n=1 Tax=Salvia miltiorrhiza TaxID=226208 RepID=UPI0025ABC84B|nr:uncharacterized protein LOC131025079 [Salvia miltiorrhiza]